MKVSPLELYMSLFCRKADVKGVALLQDSESDTVRTSRGKSVQYLGKLFIKKATVYDIKVFKFPKLYFMPNLGIVNLCF